jgi:fucose 4-O-acetylase-like acetyltransferase
MRDQSLDQSKGLAMMTIILTHVFTRMGWEDASELFRAIGVPAFFVISGMLFTQSTSSLTKQVKRLLLPAILVGTASALVKGGSGFWRGFCLDPILIGASWFLIVLTSCIVVSTLLMKALPSKYTALIAVLLGSGIFFLHLPQAFFVWRFSQSFVFFAVGWCMGIPKHISIATVLGSSLFASVAFMLPLPVGQLFGGGCAAIAIVGASRYFKNAFLAKIGKHTLYIFLLNGPIIEMTARIIRLFF